jgi:hypothetical protein
VATLPNALIAEIANIIRFYSHSEIDNMFTRLGAPGERPGGNRLERIQAWLTLANETPDFDSVALLGGLLEELMDRDPEYREIPEYTKRLRESVKSRSSPTRVLLPARRHHSRRHALDAQPVP